jgi:hypothetical protein
VALRCSSAGITPNSLVPNDTNLTRDVFVHDRQTGTTERVSVGADGSQLNYPSEFPSISADGRYVAYRSGTQAFAYDLQTGTTELVTVTHDGSEPNGPLDGLVSISGDGRYVSFLSKASNILAGDTNNKLDVFVYDRQTGITERVNDNADGSQRENDSGYHTISADGGFIAYEYFGGITRIFVNTLARPHVNTLTGATINEGGTYSENGFFYDSNSGATSWTGAVDYGDGSGSQSLALSGMNFSLSHVYKDNGNYIVTVSITDDQGAIGTRTAQIIVNNVAPTVGTITTTANPLQINTSFTASASFTDPGILDAHTASWNWGDGNTTTGTVTENNGSGSVSNSHSYSSTGVYAITLSVTDNNGATTTQTFNYVTVYSSSSSFVGGNKFDNPSGANPNTSGDVKFGISAKYNNSNQLVGSAKMYFKNADIDFVSTGLSSLSTSNGKAYLTGSGTYNDAGGYSFVATGIDGTVAGGSDRVRFKIYNTSTNALVYDSQPGAGDSDDPTTTVSNGNLKVQ